MQQTCILNCPKFNIGRPNQNTKLLIQPGRSLKPKYEIINTTRSLCMRMYRNNTKQHTKLPGWPKTRKFIVMRDYSDVRKNDAKYETIERPTPNTK